MLLSSSNELHELDENTRRPTQAGRSCIQLVCVALGLNLQFNTELTLGPVSFEAQT